MSEWKKYQRVGVNELRPYVKGENLAAQNISIMQHDNPEADMGYIARSLDDPERQWYVCSDFFNENYKEV